MKRKIKSMFALVLVCIMMFAAGQSAFALNVDDIVWTVLFGITKGQAITMLIKEFGGDISNLATAITTMSPEEITALLQRFDLDASDINKLLDEQGYGIDTRVALDAITKGGYTGVYDYGDLDGDKKVTAADARLVIRYVVGLEKFTKEMITAADVNANGQVTSEDARLIMRYGVGLETKFAAEHRQKYDYD